MPSGGPHLKRRVEIAREIEMGDLGDLDHRAEAVAQRVVCSQREGVRIRLGGRGRGRCAYLVRVMDGVRRRLRLG